MCVFGSFKLDSQKIFWVFRLYLSINLQTDQKTVYSGNKYQKILSLSHEMK